MPRFALAIFALLAFGLLPQTAGAQGPAQASAQSSAPLILISIDGFRPDYLARGVSPHLSALAAGGVRARRMIPAYPSITFPNHYTLVTGLYPDHHGIVNNNFEDPAMAPAAKGPFTMASKEEGWWSEATPIWVTAEEAGLRTAVLFWPGAETPHHGVRPGFWRPFDPAVSATARVDMVLGWLDLPADQRPRFLTLYFEPVDTAGHRFGPASAEVNQAIGEADRAIGRLVAGLKARGLAANLIIVSDHGMAPVAAGHSLMLDDMIDVGAVHVVFEGSTLGVDIPDSDAGRAAGARLLARHPHLQCWRRGDVPARLHYGTNPRVPDIVCMPQSGWLVGTRAGAARELAGHHSPQKGAHGYDIADPLMGALFIANGPAFRAGLVIRPFPNVDVYPLMAGLLGLRARAGDGDATELAPILAH